MTQHATSKAITALTTALLLLSILSIVESASLHKPHVRMLRLCSSKLSDALYIVCRERGYNEPYYSSEDVPRIDNGQGLVEECCFHSCTYEQLEQYCKPIPEEKHSDSKDIIEESYRIVNLPYSSATKDLSEESPRSKMDYVDGAIKRKVDDLKRGRNGEKGGRNHVGECKGKADAKKRHPRGRHCRCRRRRLGCRRAGKISRADVEPIDNQFVTTSPMDKPTSFSSIS